MKKNLFLIISLLLSTNLFIKATDSGSDDGFEAGSLDY